MFEVRISKSTRDRSLLVEGVSKCSYMGPIFARFPGSGPVFQSVPDWRPMFEVGISMSPGERPLIPEGISKFSWKKRYFQVFLVAG